ncbi:hypothetical protein J0J19_23155, partial [Vibrio vulnificus]|uniref:hypothetical protein n=1 Tax=Vibrio vulnificus TaxID=672 RepID=UPI0019D475B7
MMINLSIRILVFLIILTNFTLARAQNSKDYWQCSIIDNNKQEWTVNSYYAISTQHKALEACKKHSIYPKSCKLS